MRTLLALGMAMLLTAGLAGAAELAAVEMLPAEVEVPSEYAVCFYAGLPFGTCLSLFYFCYLTLRLPYALCFLA